MTGSQAARSQGALLLAQAGDAPTIAAATGWPVATIASYLSGQRNPSTERKERIAELWPFVAVEAWLLHEATETVSAARPDVEADAAMPPTGQAVNDLARRLTAQARREMAAIELLDAHVDPLVFGKRLDALGALLAKLGKFTGSQLTERQILDSPRFKVIEREIIRALTPWPDALRAVADVLEDL